jgi:methylmalonyl-CoA/ethylmalonyl-CoA epimerase
MRERLLAERVTRVRLDHIAFGVQRLADVTPLLVGELGGRPRAGGPGKGNAFNGAQWSFPEGGKVEVLEPAGEPGGFMHRFLEARGPGLHHMTFLVPDIYRARDRAEGLGYQIVGFDDSYPRWREAFIHPRTGPGVVVQMAQFDPDAPGEGWRADWPFPPSPPAKEPPARLVGPRLTARSMGNARRLWTELLDAEAEEAPDGSVMFRWERSAIRVTVQEDGGRPEGPSCVEVACPRALELPAGPHPTFGVPFVQVSV